MPISDSSLQLLIGNYRAWEGKSMPVHYRDLLDALRELQERRAADKAQTAPIPRTASNGADHD